VSNPDPYRFRLIREHVTVADPWDQHEWYDPNRRSTWRDALGRIVDDGRWRWRYLECNNVDCPAEAIYREDVVTNLADEWDERRGADR
jgi:hypothetical protein